MTKPIHVLYVMSDLLEGRGGIQSVVMAIYQHIKRDNVQIDFVIHQDENPSFVPTVQKLGSKVYQAPQCKEIGLLAYARWWNRFFKEHPEYKIVHGHMKAYMSLYLWIAKLHGRTTIAHSHIAYPQLRFFKKYAEKLMLLPLRWMVDYHFACSVQAGEYLYGKNTVKKPTFHFIPNARDTKVFVFDAEKRQTMRQKLNLTDKFVVGHVGRFDKQKNHVFLVQIFKEIYKHNPQARLLLFGTGRLKAKIEQQVAELGLAEVVMFMGVVPNPQDYYQAMDVFLFPSLYEGLGMVLTEAQIAGLPCVFSANLPREIEIVPELCHRVSLTQSAEEWANVTLAQAGVERISHAKEAAEKGFEITETAKKLEAFYINPNNEWIEKKV
ncbi:MAG: glycosyltransferase [Elusimicrobiaceae bacterium]|nr:glycosyltransferase [Elusimicrobiaceae bacterium]